MTSPWRADSTYAAIGTPSSCAKEGLWPRFDREVTVAALAAACRRSYWAEWQRIRCPALVVLGEKGFIGPQESDRMRRLRPDIPIVVIDGVGHDLHLEDPQALYEQMAGFLRHP
ncbi:alpha/beta fold hydrolase [Nonomuraea sp. ZG12]|uniref:alpha/beta fold hydrolase n=1 Tax=Nonomuraea sp. ZG12 TaxID=3452207 RepID=UPI003F8A8040